MSFEFPDDLQFPQFAFVSSFDELKSNLNYYKRFFEQSGFMFYYELRHWTKTLESNKEKIGAYCKYCKAKMVFSKSLEDQRFELQQMDALHHGHPSVQMTINQRKEFLTTRQRTCENKPTKNEDLTKLCKEFITDWLTDYQRQIKQTLMQSMKSKTRQSKSIDSTFIRKSINAKNQMIDENLEKQLNTRFDLWDHLVSQILKNAGFKKIGFSEKANQRSLLDSLMVNDTFSSIQQSLSVPRTIFIIRREVLLEKKLGSIIFSHSASCQKIQVILAFSYDCYHYLSLQWFAFIQSRHSQNPINILPALLKVEGIRSFADSTLFIEDEILMVSCTLLKQTMIEKNPKYTFSISIHPLIMDQLIDSEQSLFQGQKQTIKEAIRYLNQNQACEKIKNSIKDQNTVVKMLMAYKEFTLLSSTKEGNEIGVESLSIQFYENNKLKNNFMQIANLFQLKGSITIIELPIFILTLAQNFSQDISDINDQVDQGNRISPSSQLMKEYGYFSMATESTCPQLKESFVKIFQSKKYHFEEVAIQYARLPIQLIYSLIHKTLENRISNSSFQSVREKGSVRVVDKQLKRSFQVKFCADRYQEKGLDEISVDEEIKLWYCECGFYRRFGVPCGHEILCLLFFETSLARELSNEWRIPEKRKNRQDNKTITECLTRLSF